VPVVAVPHPLQYTSEMQAVADNGLMLALFSLGGGEIILILAVVLILFGAKKLPELARGLGEGISQFRKATRDVITAANDEASDAGRSLGGIYGKPAAQALTVDNQVAELYDPAALRDELSPKKTPSAWRRLLKNMWCRVFRFMAKPRTRMQ
jgi:sec-independent protein translocase protein TatA